MATPGSLDFTPRAWGSPRGWRLGDTAPSVLSLDSLTPQNLHQREGDSKTLAVLTTEGGGAGPLSQGGAPLPSPNSAPMSPALRPPCGPAQTPDPRSWKGAAAWREPAGEKGLKG